ncbi:hypothetical protein SLEP1_g60425 [Rubroshorea leprosula]|uniref:Uncharacterized protein n=1 Tax=Rubroshorea leprosula TaxID=152421 RepID=A0AAV5MWX0_9ROSI|nr:hypothetical protein SLEP1_g60425 [Rubroshorea leprosula]
MRNPNGFCEEPRSWVPRRIHFLGSMRNLVFGNLEVPRSWFPCGTQQDGEEDDKEDDEEDGKEDAKDEDEQENKDEEKEEDEEIKVNFSLNSFNL